MLCCHQSSTTGVEGGNGTSADIDSLIDTPTNYTADSGNNGGNYPTWNPLDKNTNITLSNGNLDAAETSGSNHFAGRATFKYPATGKWYYEATIKTLGNACCIGVDNSGLANPSLSNSGVYLILVNASNNVQRYIGSSYTSFDSAYGNPAVGSVLQVAYDADADKLWLGMDNVWMGSGSSANGNPGAGTEATASNVSDPFPSVNLVTSALSVNFGQRSFAYSAPTGFKALCTTNLPDPTIADGSSAFDTSLWTGNGSTQSITGLSFSPDFVWIKNRNNTADHRVYDTVRGALKEILPNQTNTETTRANSLTAFNSDGYSLGSYGGVNNNGTTAVGWAWDGGTSTTSNTDGSITSNVRANASAGFSIVGYTGTGSNATIGHGLNAAPEFIIAKGRSVTGDWLVYHSGFGATKYAALNSTDQAWTTALAWNDTEPTGSVFSIGTASQINTSSSTNIAYCFAPVSQYSSFGVYTGNGNTDGTFVFTGFKVAFLLMKKSSGTGAWLIWDNTRQDFNAQGPYLQPQSNTTEGDADYVDFLSNGFKWRTTNAAMNESSSTYVYAAFAEHPFKTARAR